MSPRQQQGLTLLEIMLAIVLAGLMSVYFLNFLKQHEISYEVGQTAAQMRYILLTSQKYYLDNNNTFPTSIDQLSYLSQNEKCSPWTTQQTSTNCGEHQEYALSSSQNAAGIFVAVSIQVIGEKVADEIVSLLPNSSSKLLNQSSSGKAQPHGTYQVTASVGAPGVPFYSHGALIIKQLAYQAVSGYQSSCLTKKPACPAGFEPKYEVAMTSFPFRQPDSGGDIDSCQVGSHGVRVAPGPDTSNNSTWYNVDDDYDWNPYMHVDEGAGVFGCQDPTETSYIGVIYYCAPSTNMFNNDYDSTSCDSFNAEGVGCSTTTMYSNSTESALALCPEPTS